ncbi:carboxylate-amine ligase [Saccharothrix ecbatanensis]|uniref:Putative glutamate--cysteine ligase 2 n=1 Tax=Saccharothrix ecbatanensis TaxID=1105145 RepID=A0A7W9M024_9PSEU|nr:glutamate--cysteine ligase [Saccharothrix ecbatanensis]MBB5802333.1 carboxylate-amine ligase [Saccharothrix ecbatanensis]
MTVGVEEEFLLVDPSTRHPVARAGDVLARVRGLPPGAEVHRELSRAQVEFASGVCADLDELRDQLVTGRRVLADAAYSEGLRLIPSGSPVFADPDPGLSEGERFERIEAMYRGQVDDYQCCGCHVHVGVPDRETAVRVVNHLRPWLPTLLALGANSPFVRGRDTGYASWRMIDQAGFPGSGVPPFFRTAADHDLRVTQLMACGALVDAAMTFWLARPSPRYPTVEVRAADTVATVDDAVLQAGLTRALVDAALAGGTAPDLDDQVLAAAVWSAARYGLTGPGVDPFAARQVPAVELVEALLEHVSDALGDDRDRVRKLVRGVLENGTGAERQRRAGSPEAAVDLLACTGVRAGSPPS